MIRILESKTTDVVGKYWYYLICDEGDTKPTGEFPADSGKIIANGSRLFETGTEIRYEYNNGSWTAIGQEESTLIEKTITENGTYDSADDEADGYSSVNVDVPAPVFEDKTVTPTTSEQAITADEDYDALGTVTVEAVTATIDSNIKPENIKSGITILGVEGTYTGE